MSFFVRFESKEDLELLTKLVENTVKRVSRNPVSFVDIADCMYRVVDSLHSYAPLKDAHLMGVPDEVIEEDKAKKRATRKPRQKGSGKVSDALALCSTHKTYQAKQVPRTDCETCWEAYKKFNPTKYANARRKFERKQNQA